MAGLIQRFLLILLLSVWSVAVAEEFQEPSDAESNKSLDIELNKTSDVELNEPSDVEASESSDDEPQRSSEDKPQESSDDESEDSSYDEPEESSYDEPQESLYDEPKEFSDNELQDMADFLTFYEPSEVELPGPSELESHDLSGVETYVSSHIESLESSEVEENQFAGIEFPVFSGVEIHKRTEDDASPLEKSSYGPVYAHPPDFGYRHNEEEFMEDSKVSFRIGEVDAATDVDILEKSQTSDWAEGTEFSFLEWPGEPFLKFSNWTKFDPNRSAQFEQHACGSQYGSPLSAYGYEYLYVSEMMFTSYVTALESPEENKPEGDVMALDFKFTLNHLIVPTGSRVLIYEISQRSTYFVPQAFPHVNRVVTSICCRKKDLWCVNSNSFVVIWDINNVDRLYMSFDEGTYYEERDIREHNKDGRFTQLFLVKFMTEYNILSLYFGTPEGQAFVVYIPLVEDKDVREYLINPGKLPYKDYFMAEKFANDYGDYLYWDAETLRYSDNAGQSLKHITLFLSSTEGSKTIFQMSRATNIGKNAMGKTEKSGKFAVLREDGNILYGRMVSGTPLRAFLMRGPKISREAMGISFNLNGKLTVVYPPKLLREETCHHPQMKLKEMIVPISKYLLPYLEDVNLDSTDGTEPCEIFHFTSSLKSSTIYMDKGVSVVFNISYAQTNLEPPRLSIKLSDPYQLKVFSIPRESRRDNNVYHMHTWEINVTPYQEHISPAEEKLWGVTHLMIGAVGASMRCQENPFMIAHVGVSCPPTKKLKVVYTNTKQIYCDEYMGNYRYTIAKEDWDPDIFYNQKSQVNPENKSENYHVDSKGNLITHYDFEKLGCPIEPHIADDFIPEIHLLDGDKDTGIINADYIIYETHGLNSYTYTATVATSGCTHKPQSWDEMYYGRKTKENVTIVNAWTRKNYFQCKNKHRKNVKRLHMSSLSRSEKNHKFEVMGSKWDNAIKWTPSDYLVYIFEVIVVDPEFSYCDLRATFGVVLGSPQGKSPFPKMSIWVVIMACGLTAMATAYSLKDWYKKSHDQRKAEAALMRQAALEILAEGKVIREQHIKELDAETWEDVRKHVAAMKKPRPKFAPIKATMSWLKRRF